MTEPKASTTLDFIRPATITKMAEELAGETAVVKIAPDKDEGYIKLLGETTKLLEYSNKLVISGVEDKKAATNDLIIMGDLGKQIEVIKKEWLGPIDEHRKTVFDMFKQLTDSLAQAVRQTKTAMLLYDQEQENRRLELAGIARQEQELEDARARAENRAPVEVQAAAIPEPDTGQTRSEMGLASTVDHWKYEIIDLALIPREYMLPDAVLLGNTAKRHHDQKPVPGVRFYNEPYIASRGR